LRAGWAADVYVPDLVPGGRLGTDEALVGGRLAGGTAWHDGVPPA
jgi:hypothetical protein